MTVLDDIIAYKRREVAAAKANASFDALDTLARETGPPRGFAAALAARAAARADKGPALIAEIKKASPSKGLIRADFDPAALARAYAAGGATCLSVLTDGPSFQGSAENLRAARAATSLPILRKDFTIDPYQIAEARAWGADAILLIMACLDVARARELEAAAHGYGLDVLAECHDRSELDQALQLETPLIGVNNRDLRTFETTLRTTVDLAAAVPGDRLLVSESGIASPADIASLRAAGAKAFLVGETLMRQPDVEAATRTLLSPPEPRPA